MNTITVDPLALAFELELKAADSRCANCGCKSMTICGELSATQVVNCTLTCQIECECTRCKCRDVRTFTFEKDAKFVF
jgi:hypothetical protein